MNADSPFIVTRRGKVLRKHRAGPEMINDRMKRVITLMVHGRYGDASKTPVELYRAAELSGYRRKGIRALFETATVFREAYAAEQEKRGPPALTLDEVVDFIVRDRKTPKPHPISAESILYPNQSTGTRKRVRPDGRPALRLPRQSGIGSLRSR